jgi:hypothetical protein
MTRTISYAAFALATAFVTAGLTGCGQVDEQLAEASVQSALQTSRSAGLGKMTYEVIDDKTCFDAATAAEEAASRPAVGLYPEGCATKTADGTALHVELADCTGPFGRVHLNGGVDARFSPASCDTVHAEIADAGDLAANERPLDYSASADITAVDTRRNVSWAGHWSTTTKRGWEVEQTSDLDVVVELSSDCLSLDGTTSGHVDRYNLDARIEGLRICPGTCPAAGNVSIELDGPRRDRSLAVAFDGSNIAKVTGNDGDVFDVEMVCNDDEDG